MAKCLAFTVSGVPVKVYPVLIDAVEYLCSQRAGVRYEKKLAAKDMKRLISGEMTLEDYQNLKMENDKLKTESFVKEREETPKEEMASEADEDVVASGYASRGRGRPPKRRKVKEVYCCRVCNSYRLRVVDYGRADGLNMLECANRKCLASIELTDKPAGTVIEAPVDSKINCGWMMDSIWNYRYPKMSRIESGELSANPEISGIETGGDDVLHAIHCPGQAEMVRIM